MQVTKLNKEHLKKYLITGGNGFIGKHLVNQLIREKSKVIIIDNLSNCSYIGEENNIWNNEKINKNKQLVFYNADIRDKETIQEIFKKNHDIDSCIHLAAKISVSDSIKNPSETMDVNVNGTRNVLEAAANNGVKSFIFASSAAVYGNSINLPLSEEENPNPISPYGLSKLKGEELVSKFSKDIPNTISLRFFNIYGKGQSSEYAGVITKFFERLSNGLAPVIYGNGSQIRDFISINDIVRAILTVSCMDTISINYRTSFSNIFNISTGKPTRIIDLAKIMIYLFKSVNSSTKYNVNDVVFVNPIDGDILESYGDTTKTKKLIGFSCVDDLSLGLQRIYNESIKEIKIAEII